MSTVDRAEPLSSPEGDGQGYLSDEWLEDLRDFEIAGPREAAAFLLGEFVEAFELMEAARCEVSDLPLASQPTKRVSVSTGGWSGAEDLIAIVLSKFWISFFHVEWHRGGRFVFEVPARLAKQSPGQDDTGSLPPALADDEIIR